MSELVVTVFDEPCGRISAAPTSLEYTFSYWPDWRATSRHGISLSLPRGVETDPAHARAFFGGLLPEGAARRHVAQAEGIDELDDVAFLERFGEECPGAIRVFTNERFAQLRADLPVDVEWLDLAGESELVRELRVPGVRPADRYSISLAGAQLKRGVRVDDVGTPQRRIGVPRGGTRSTHILKLAVAGYEGIVQNEHATMRLAASIGIRTSMTRVTQLGDEPVLIVDRYDRSLGADLHAVPLHQEDMCQALGRLPSQKYERYDADRGVAIGPTVDDVVGLLRTNVRPSVQQVDEFLRMFWFNVIVGNVDAHAKNYSLLYRDDLDGIDMSPLYDSICITAHHAREPAQLRHANEPLVMHVGHCTRFWQLTRTDIEQFARDLAIRPGYVLQVLARLVERVDGSVDDVIEACQAAPATRHAVLDLVRGEVHERCAFLRRVISG